MQLKPSPESVYAVSDDLVARKIGREVILIAIDTDMSEKEDQFFTLNSTAQIIWRKINGKKSLKNIIKSLAHEYDSPAEVLENDVITLISQLLERKLLVRIS